MGLKCSVLCSFCNGDSCDNIPEVLSESDDEYEETTDVDQFLTITMNDSCSEDENEDEEDSEPDIDQPGPSTRSKTEILNLTR